MANAGENKRRAGRGTAPPRPEQLTASIMSWSSSYYISQQRSGDGGRVGDEAILDIVGGIVAVSPRHRAYIGERVEISVVCARTFDENTGEGAGKPFLLFMNLRRKQRSLLVYLPADAFWGLLAMIERTADACVEATFEPLLRGSGSLLSLWIGPRAGLEQLNF